ncbi:hypothetical protein YB2330_000017 [Saitoella coloradoensis]
MSTQPEKKDIVGGGNQGHDAEHEHNPSWKPEGVTERHVEQHGTEKKQEISEEEGMEGADAKDLE